MRYKLFAAFVLSGTVLIGGIASAQHHRNQAHKGHAAAPPDTRRLVQFPPPLVEHTLANMRDHLVALQVIIEALAQAKYDAAAETAEGRLGMSSLRLHGAHQVAPFMPEGMKAAGTAMHRAASRFAIEAQNSGVTGDLKPALVALGEVMNACVACHAGYRLK